MKLDRLQIGQLSQFGDALLQLYDMFLEMTRNERQVSLPMLQRA